MGKESSTNTRTLSDRDRYILCELARDPNLSARELRDILEEAYGINVSRVTVSETIRKLREAGVFREALIPNEENLFFSLFEFQFFPPKFREHWREALEYIKKSKHTLLFFLSDGVYKWKTVMVFRDREQESKWIHNFFKEFGPLILDLRNSVVTNVLKFETDPEVFETLI